MNIDMGGITVEEAAANIRSAMTAKIPGTCTAAEFVEDPERYVAEWLGSLLPIYAAAKGVRL